MKRNGFTLIELLAVIVILAIIALIATPIILGIINDAREKANERSVELYASAIRNAVASYQLTNPNAPTKFTDLNVQYDGKVECTVEELYENGSFYLEGCTVNGSEKEYSYGQKENNIEPSCTLDDRDKDGIASLSDVITCGTENFYVMYNENNEITMLSMFNLYVGYNVDIMNNYKTTPVENPTGIQNELAKGYIGEDKISYATVEFSTTGMYWSSTTSSYPAFVYDERSVLYQYVSEYERILKEDLKVSSAKATLINYEQLVFLGCSLSTLTPSCSDAPEWVYSTNYWTGTTVDENNIFRPRGCYFCDLSNMGDSGVRPVITISTNELK